VALEALQCDPSADSAKNPNFGPQKGDFSKMWPSSRFGLAMAGIDFIDFFDILLKCDILFGSKLWLLPNCGNASKFSYVKNFNNEKYFIQT
jgi:hypothetical protein